MKKLMICLCLIFLFGFTVPGTGLSQELSTDEIIKELKQLKERINRLEEGLSKKNQEIRRLKAKLAPELAEGFTPAAEEEKWTGRIGLSGAVEVEFGNEHRDIKDPANNFQAATTQSHDIVLATAMLGVDAEINKYTQGHILLLSEEDGTDPISVDEGTLTIGGMKETYGFYLKGGKYYPHFGELNSFFVSKPLNIEVFELNESAVEGGYGGDWFSAGAGLFRGNIQEELNTESRINDFFADAHFHNPEETLGGLSLLFGASYLSNVADSDTLEGQVVDLNGDGATNDLSDIVGGFATYLVAGYDKYSFGAEYVTATDDFQAGEMGYALDRNGVAGRSQPATWNFEFAFNPIASVQLAAKYEGSDDMFGLFPNRQFGGMVGWEFLRYTTLSAEYLHGEFEENNRNADGMSEDERDFFTLQLAIGF